MMYLRCDDMTSTDRVTRIMLDEYTTRSVTVVSGSHGNLNNSIHRKAFL
jgi:hypothetical protein